MPTPASTPKRRRRVLAIDDEPQMTEWLKMVIEADGYEVRTALIGTRGEEIYKQWRPDLVVTDLMLPDVDGYSTAGLLLYSRLSLLKNSGAMKVHCSAPSFAP